MKTKSGYETNGDYIKFKSGFTSCWNVETQNDIQHFKNELDADMHIIIKIIGCEKGYLTCKYYTEQIQGCQNCKIGYNSNCSNIKNHIQ
jgi:uncharacterized CHY-type Zn-finger protein